MSFHQAAHGQLIRTASRVLCLIVLAYSYAAAQAQDNRYTNNQYGISFQPPLGWIEDKDVGSDVLVQYLGPQRPDRTRPVLNLTAQNSVMGLTDEEINAVATELTEDFDSRGMQNAEVSDRRKITAAGFDALQMDLSYRLGNEQTRARQVYIPITEHGRTYLLTFIDTARNFDQSLPAATNSINSFTATGVNRAATNARPAAQTGSGRGAGDYTLLLVIVGFIALAVIIGALYLLLQKRAR